MVLYGGPTSGNAYDTMCLNRKLVNNKLEWCYEHQNRSDLTTLLLIARQKTFQVYGKPQGSLMSDLGYQQESPSTRQGMRTNPKSIERKKENLYSTFLHYT